MLKRLTLCLSLLALIVPASFGEDNWIDLFDGKTLEGWISRGGEATYKVEEGAIVGTSAPNTSNTFLCTEKHYSDFVLELEFKVDPTLNSGIQIRSNSFPDYKDGRVHGYQVEIDPSTRAYSAGIYDESRRGWLFKLDQNEAARKAFKSEDWNRYRIVAIGDTIQTWINGVPAADLRDDMTAEGFIGLQVHGVGKRTDPLQVRWRNVRLLDLGEEAWVSLFDGKSFDGWEMNENPDSVALEDGVIVAGGGPRGHLFYLGEVANHDFKNFEFRCDVMTEPNANSGIFFHTEVETGRLNKGYEMQINNSHTDPKRTGSLWAIEDLFETEAKDNEWFSCFIRVLGKRILLKVDDKTVVDYTEPENPVREKGREGRLLDRGTFALQAHDPGSIVRFKNIELKVLPD